jgi:hypothetical protein
VDTLTIRQIADAITAGDRAQVRAMIEARPEFVNMAPWSISRRTISGDRANSHRAPPPFSARRTGCARAISPATS